MSVSTDSFTKVTEGAIFYPELGVSVVELTMPIGDLEKIVEEISEVLSDIEKFYSKE